MVRKWSACPGLCMYSNGDYVRTAAGRTVTTGHHRLKIHFDFTDVKTQEGKLYFTIYEMCSWEFSNTVWSIHSAPCPSQKPNTSYRTGAVLSGTAFAYHTGGPGFESQHCENKYIIKRSYSQWQQKLHGS